MRYEEGPTARADVLIDAPLDRVWALVTDINPRRRYGQRRTGVLPGVVVGVVPGVVVGVVPGVVRLMIAVMQR
jgi:hypothetical protein